MLYNEVEIDRRNMAQLTYEKEITGLVPIDPYNDFISEGGKIWDRIKSVAEGNQCVPHMMQILEEARKAGIRVFYAMHRRYRPGDYETWERPLQTDWWSAGKSGLARRNRFLAKGSVC
jgi:ureidoacrylate peracid hydrolase